MIDTIAALANRMQPHDLIYDPLLEELGHLFSRMDGGYDDAARQAGFHCSGCDNNCCRSLFYHYTMVEYLYLLKGFSKLSTQAQKRIMARVKSPEHETDRRPLCPANEKERCLLYPYRPMICRLHGIPHFLSRPDGARVEGPGCDAYYRSNTGENRHLLDRTPFYREMAALEAEIRGKTGFSGKIKMTVAEILAAHKSDQNLIL